MEQMFGAGTLVRDVAAPGRYRRGRSAQRRLRAWIAGVAVAVSAVVVLGGVAYGGATSGTQHLVVHRGDTLWALAQSHYPGDDVQSRVTELEAVNHLRSAQISPGQVLTLPAP